MNIEVSRRERKKEETRGRIFREAIRLFKKRGFDATTIDEITERADVAKGTFFNYFPRKESVLAYLSEQQLVEVESNAEAIFSASDPASAKLVGIYLAAAAAYTQDRELSRYVLNELMKRAFDVTEEGAHGTRWNTLIHRALAMGRDSGELRADLDIPRAAEVFTGVYYSTVYTWVNCEDMPGHADYDLLAELRERFALLLDGMAARRRP